MDDRKRQPLPIRILCVVGWLGVAIAAARIVAQWRDISALPTAHILGAPLALAVTAIALLGYWWMRRWGVWLMGAGVLARVATGITGTLPLRPSDLAWPAVILIVGLTYYRRLR